MKVIYLMFILRLRGFDLSVQFNVYAVEGREDQLTYALEFGRNVTDYFESYFGLAYPLPKMGTVLCYS